jgi:hypothetical protein
MAYKTFYIRKDEFYTAVLTPAFQDLIPNTGNFNGTLGEFTYYGDVVTKQHIINIKRTKNILQRRDASCDLNYKKLMGTTDRIITVEELYAATQHCANGFYRGSLKDWRNNDPLFGNKILPFFQEATLTDITSNAYFGDTQRIETPAQEWSTTKFDGIFKWLRKYAAAGVIPASQTFAMPAGDLRQAPATCFALVKSAYDRQPTLMRNTPAGEKAFYVSDPINSGYNDYMRQLGDESSFIVERYANGVEVSSYLGIRIYVEPIWEAVLAELYGQNSNALILTLRGNFIFATDEQYGEGPNLDESIMVWYERKDLSWYFQEFLKAGTQLALPEFTVFSLPA